MVVVTLTLDAVLSILFGFIILIWPKSLNYLVDLWLIITGILSLVNVSLAI